MSETAISAFGIFEFVDFKPFNNLVFRDNHLGNSIPFIDYKILITHVNENNTYFSSVIRVAFLLPHKLFILWFSTFIFRLFVDDVWIKKISETHKGNFRFVQTISLTDEKGVHQPEQGARVEITVFIVLLLLRLVR